MTTKDQILVILKRNKNLLSRFGLSNIGLFGSYVRNEQRDNSDIDILIDFEPDKETFDNYMAVCDILEGLFLNERIEIVTKNALSPYIGPTILKETLYA
jgi:uncharacterized protein